MDRVKSRQPANRNC